MPKLVAQHHMSDLNAVGLAEQRGGQRPRLQRGVVGRSRAVQVVVEPQRIDPEFFATARAMQKVGIGEAHLRQIDTDLRLGHGLSSNLPWVMVVAPLATASNANELSSMP